MSLLTLATDLLSTIRYQDVFAHPDCDSLLTTNLLQVVNRLVKTCCPQACCLEQVVASPILPLVDKWQQAAGKIENFVLFLAVQFAEICIKIC